MRLVTAPPRLATGWDASPGRFANRCLPLRIANQAGWFVLNSHALRITWNGGNDTSDLEIESLDGEDQLPRQQPLRERVYSPSTSPPLQDSRRLQPPGPRAGQAAGRTGSYPLEGIVETDWARLHLHDELAAHPRRSCPSSSRRASRSA